MADGQRRVTSATAPAFFAEVAERARAAMQAAPTVIERWYRIGDRILYIRFLGPALITVIAPAITHRQIARPDEMPALTLDCWDCTTLAQPFPDSPVVKSDFTPRGEVPALTDRRYHVGFEPTGRLLSMIDVASRRAFYCVGDAALIPRFDVAEPIRNILGWFMRANGRQLMHGGAVGHAEGGALLVGRSGAGKSNTALTCLDAGLGYVSDDFCAVSVDPEPVVYSLYCTAKTRESDLDRHPFLRGLAPDHDPAQRDKIIYHLHRSVPERMLGQMPIRAILLVRRGGAACRTDPVSPAAVLAASAPDTAMLLADAGPEVLRTLGSLVRRAPCFTLQLGPDPSRIAPTIEALLDRLPAG